MEPLFELDDKNYDINAQIIEAVTVRAIIRDGDCIAVQQASNGLCKLIGGGVEGNETHILTLKREIAEEAGRKLLEDSVSLIGYSIEKHKDIFDSSKVFTRKTYFYECKISDEIIACNMTGSEIDAGFKMKMLTPEEIINANESFKNKSWVLRDTIFVENYLNFK